MRDEGVFPDTYEFAKELRRDEVEMTWPLQTNQSSFNPKSTSGFRSTASRR